jgi:hypothetical protein
VLRSHSGESGLTVAERTPARHRWAAPEEATSEPLLLFVVGVEPDDWLLAHSLVERLQPVKDDRAGAAGSLIAAEVVGHDGGNALEIDFSPGTIGRALNRFMHHLLVPAEG